VYTYCKKTAELYRAEFRDLLRAKAHIQDGLYREEDDDSALRYTLDADRLLEIGSKFTAKIARSVENSAKKIANRESLRVIRADELPRSLWVRLTNIWTASEEMGHLSENPAPLFTKDGQIIAEIDLSAILHDIGDIFHNYRLKLRKIAIRLLDAVLHTLEPMFEQVMAQGLAGEAQNIEEWIDTQRQLLDVSLIGPMGLVCDELHTRWLRRISRMVFGLLEGLLTRRFPAPSVDGPAASSCQLFTRLIEDIENQLAEGLPERFVNRLTATCKSLVELHAKSTPELIAIYERNEKDVKKIQDSSTEEQDELVYEEDSKVIQGALRSDWRSGC
jgi:hypothetical protein